jgi:glycosyltransferase involved in cell wall biosynthesis
MDYRPNVDGVEHFGREIFPILRRAVPELEFWIVGRNPTPRVRALASAEGVRVTGEVDDVGEYLARAAVAVVPLRIAQGVQNKILEAMAAGTPVVATSKAFEGIDATPGADLLVADGAADFAGAVERLLRDSHERERLAASARKVVETRYSWDSSMAELERILREAVHRVA